MQTELTNRGDEGRFRSEERTTHSDLDIKATDVWRPDSSAAMDEKDSDRHQDANMTQTKETFNILTEPQTCSSNDQTDATKPNQGGISLVFTTGGNTAVTREDGLAPFQAVRPESPDVLGTSVPSSASADINPQTSVESKDDYGAQSRLRLTLSGNIAETFTSSSLKTEALQRDCPSALVLKLSDSDNPIKINKTPSVASLKETTEATIPTVTRESELLPSQSERLDALKETHFESTTKVFTAEPETEGEKTQQLENTGDRNPDVLRNNREKEITEFAEKAGRFSTATALKTCVKAAQSDPFMADTDAGEQDRRVGRDPDKVFTIVLDLQPWGAQQSGYVGAGRADGFRWSPEAKSEEIPNPGFPEKKSRISPASGSPGSHGEELDSVPTPLALADGGQKGSSSQLESKENQTHEIKKNEAPTLSKSSKREPCDERSAETTLPVSKTEATPCQPGGTAESPVLGSAKDWVPNRDETETEMLIDATVKQPTTADTATSAGAPGEGAARGGADGFQCADGKHCPVPAEQESTSPQNEESKWEQSGVLKEIVLPLVKPQNPESMEPERTPPAFLCGPGAGETTGGSPGSHGYRSTLLESLSDTQGSVEQSNIIWRKPHVDLKGYLTFSPGDADIRLARTVQHVLACRYQPARLDAAAMAKQLEEAREHLRSVQEQVAAVKSSATKTPDPKALERAEGEWSSVLLDASATVQVKAAQLDQVKKYHLQKKITRAFLEVIAVEKEKMSLNVLGSSFLQIEKLNALLQTMEQKESMIEDLLCLSSQLSVHLSDEESSGVLPAQLAEIQEEWRLLKGSIQRAHRQASNSTRQSKLILREAGQLKANLDALLKFETDNLSPLDVVCLRADLKGYYLLYYSCSLRRMPSSVSSGSEGKSCD
ncbi:uncharacterized protein LOC118566189 [Fundulus heteroclitus]|uniref:uncharacterized protein LOC118566189 n=1 Tax=Fundulus heteroclitus TaxID=8078 RepID=UPI00165C7F7F|nr:uncharacterized protein LOC118566189 [Fundulus heteroclitus]